LYDPYISKEEKGEIIFVECNDLINCNNRDTILDICTNSDRHVEWIEFALDKGFIYAVIEKPLVTSYVDLMRIESRLNGKTEFYTVNYNYLCSPVLSSIENIIDSQKLKIVKIRTNFSKNRIYDSKTKRGADKNGALLHNFLIEIPHQLSIAFKLLGQVRDIDLCYAKDMVEENQVYKNHGEGFIKVIHNNGITSEHFSNLSNAHTIREIIIEFEDDHILIGYFGVHPEYIGKVELRRNGKIVFTDIIGDKSIDSFLSKVLLFFDNKIDNPCDIKFAIDINKVILEGIDKTIQRRKKSPINIYD
jgi:predicted dehydrogenase